MDALATPRKHQLFALGLILLLALNLYLYGPLFSPQQRPYKGSIAAGYAGITRFIAEHPDPWGWNPQQYAGQPTQFTYPPLLPYTASALHWLTGMEPFRAYRSIVALFACLGPITLAFAFYYFTRNLILSLLLGLGYSVCSPVYGLFERIDADRGLYYLPWRILVLMKYGEGPHVVGLTLLPLILVSLRWGLARTGWPSLFLMTIALATAPLTNWLCALALTLCVFTMLLSGVQNVPRLFGAGALGYALSSFWLTPEYVKTTLFNWPKDAYGYQVEQNHWPFYGGLLLTLASTAWLFRRYNASWPLRFLTLASLTFLWISGGFYLYGIDTLPESRRYILEFELFFFLALFAWAWTALNTSEAIDKVCVGIFTVALLAYGSGQVQKSLTRGWSDWGIVDREQTLEFQLARWLADQHPQGRVFVSGGLRFRLNAWFPLHQVSGTFESGLRNRIAADYFYQVRTDANSKSGEEAVEALRELTTIGAEYAVVHDAASEEYYRDIKTPAKFQALGPVVFAPTPNDRVHKLPFRSLAHLVSPEEFPKDQFKEALPRFYSALSDSTRPPLLVKEINPSKWTITGPIPDGMNIAFSMNWDPGWQALQDGVPIEIKSSKVGLIQLLPKPAPSSTIELTYRGTTQQKLFGALSLLAWVVSIGLCIRSRSWQASTSTPSS
jgi:hypothetical protein